MSLHVFANFVTSFGTAANNRGDNQGGNVTPLQKLLWHGEPHTTVSAEAIRFAFRRRLQAQGEKCNRNWAEHVADIPDAILEQMKKVFKGDVNAPCGYFVDPDFAWYRDRSATGYADDDLLGFMSAEAAKEEAEATGEDAIADNEQSDAPSSQAKPGKKGRRKKGTTFVRRAVLEVTRAISLTPFSGDVTFNAASPGATPSAQKKGVNPVPYGTEVHATRFQYGIALTPERLRDKSLVAKAISALCELGTVAGNHGRFLFDFAPDSIVIRITDDPAPRLLYCFESDDGRAVDAPVLRERVEQEDIEPRELILGGSFANSEVGRFLRSRGAFPEESQNNGCGVKAAAREAVKRINGRLGIEE